MGAVYAHLTDSGCLVYDYQAKCYYWKRGETVWRRLLTAGRADIYNNILLYPTYPCNKQAVRTHNPTLSNGIVVCVASERSQVYSLDLVQ